MAYHLSFLGYSVERRLNGLIRSVKHKKKTELQVILTLKKGPHTLHSLKYKSLQKRRWKFIHYFWLLRPNCQIEYYIKREKTEYDICYASDQNLPWFNFIFLLPGSCKDYENEFLQMENIIWVFWLKQVYSQPAFECGLMEEKLSSDIVVLVRYPLMTPQS